MAAGYEDCQCESFVYTYSKTWLHIMSEQKHTHIFSAITSNSAEAISFHKPPFFWGDNYKSRQIRWSSNQNKDSLFFSHRQSTGQSHWLVSEPWWRRLHKEKETKPKQQRDAVTDTQGERGRGRRDEMWIGKKDKEIRNEEVTFERKERETEVIQGGERKWC